MADPLDWRPADRARRAHPKVGRCCGTVHEYCGPRRRQRAAERGAQRPMPRGTKVPITPEVLRWAVEESGYTDELLANHADVSGDDLASWKRGDTRRSCIGSLRRFFSQLHRSKRRCRFSSDPSDRSSCEHSRRRSDDTFDGRVANRRSSVGFPRNSTSRRQTFRAIHCLTPRTPPGSVCGSA